MTLQRQRSLLFDGRSADTEDQTIQQAESAARKALEQANRVLETARSEFAGAQSGSEHRRHEYTHRQTAHAQAQQRLNETLDMHGLTENTLRLRLERDNAWSEQERSGAGWVAGESRTGPGALTGTA
ncbi:MAG: hypothetical protein HC808_10395 [Candidatus Competibacteraceae bacterium]|nr:hypothetical protein [Candidatus Competibacteraceae bacterium]